MSIFSTNRNSPQRAITADNRPGNCWAFSGDQGHLVLKLSHKIFVRYITIEHIPRAMSPSGQIRSAPREISISALSSPTDKVVVLKLNQLFIWSLRSAIMSPKSSTTSAGRAFKCSRSFTMPISWPKMSWSSSTRIGARSIPVCIESAFTAIQNEVYFL